MKTKIIISKSYNPWYNLAVEELLLRKLNQNEAIMFLWQNQNTVVIGKNQNPWKECRTELLEEEGGKLARRSSGGGAVFHDLGNLNFSFIVDKKEFDIKKQLNLVLAAVKSADISAEFSGRNDLLAEGKKFSGNAYSYRKLSSLHHGTILIDSNFDKMTRYLQVSEEKITSKGIDSIRSRVVNLKELNNSLNIELMQNMLIDQFIEFYGNPIEIFEDTNFLESDELTNIFENYSSWDWRYGESPQFDIEFFNRFSWGEVQMLISLKHGKIQKAKIYSDAMDEIFIEDLSKVLLEKVFHKNILKESILSLASEKSRINMVEDLNEWLDTKTF